MKNLTLENIARVCGGTYYGPADKLQEEVMSVITDSRKAEEGCLFVPIVGERVDAHKFIPQVMEAGALATLSERVLDNADFPYIAVESSLQAVKDIAEFYLKQLQIPVVGITGSVGKTSTKEVIASVLNQKYHTLKTQGNFNNELGLPLTVFRLRDGDEIAVLEMGISDFGEMTRLAQIARPDTCVITNIGTCHLENLGDRNGVLKAKTEIFKFLRPEGHIVLNGDDDKLITVDEVNGKKPERFGINYKDGVYAKDIENLGLSGTKFVISGLNCVDGCKDFEVTVPVPGHHMIYNALAAACVGAALELTSTQIADGIADLKTISGRNNIIKTSKYTLIDDCYNANPVSMKASVDVLDMAIGRKVCILGNMYELGENEKNLHYDVGQYIGTKNIDVLITIGDLARHIAMGTDDYMETHFGSYDCEIHSFDDMEEFNMAYSSILKDNDNILIKASHAMKFADIVELLSKDN